MPKALFSDIFDTEIPSDIAAEFKNCIIERCALDTEERTLDTVLKSEKYISAEMKHRLSAALKDALRLNSCLVSCVFSGEAFCPAACSDIAAEIKIKNAAINGYFNGADFSLDGDCVNITLKHGGYNTIADCGFENAFKVAVRERFSCEVTVSFGGQLENVEIKLPEPEAAPVKAETAKPKPRKTERPAAPKTEINFEKREERPDNGIVYLDKPQQFYGRGGISNHTRDMISITGDDTEIACWGEVFGMETRDIKTKRGTDMTIVNFSFSDHTNSLNASLFIDTRRMGDIAPLKDGAFILVNGSYEFDNYKKDFVVKPRAMALLQKYTEKDGHEGEKRVEIGRASCRERV